MGLMQTNLESILVSSGKKISKKLIPYLKLDDVENSDFSNQVQNTYEKLGGILGLYPVGFRGWDIEIEGIGVELDEQLHFNRYRELTLDADVYSQLPTFPHIEYVKMCKNREAECMKAGHYGGKWTNPSCEKQFGASGANGNIDSEGAPRWKQRAFYDFVKDLTPLLIDTRIVRISIWDKIDINGVEVLLKDVLRKDAMEAHIPIWQLIESRI